MARAIEIGPTTRCQLMVRDSSTTMTEARLNTSFNEYYSIGGNSSTHDANGNLTDNGDGHTFTWDAFNRLREVYEDGTPYAMEVYLYDASNRRVKIDVHYGSGVDTEFAYDGWQVVEEHYEDGGYPQVRQFVYGAYIDEPLMVEDANGDCFFYHQNTIYSVYGITDDSGNTVEEYEYGPYGKHTADQGFEDNPYTFTGRRYDPESGLLRYRMRYYDPERGRFISRDPIGVADGPHLYNYVRSNPPNYADPNGLAAKKCNNCGPDISGWLVDRMNQNQNHPLIRQGRRVWTPPINAFETYRWALQFKNLVQSGGAWDFKASVSFITESCPSAGCEQTVTLCGVCFYRDVAANIHYGYVGRAGRIPREILLAEAAKVQEGGVDPPEDVLAITIGMDMWDTNNRNLCSHVKGRRLGLSYGSKEYAKKCKPCKECLTKPTTLGWGPMIVDNYYDDPIWRKDRDADKDGEGRSTSWRAQQ